MGRDEIILKELEHIQAIVGRFDTFFFLMKQVCLAGMAAIFTVSADKGLRITPCLVVLVPLTFLVIESCFRFCYWTRYVRRIDDIALELNGGSPLLKLYEISAPRPSIRDGTVWCKAIQPFDIFYYALWACVALLAALILLSDHPSHAAASGG